VSFTHLGSTPTTFGNTTGWKPPKVTAPPKPPKGGATLSFPKPSVTEGLPTLTGGLAGAAKVVGGTGPAPAPATPPAAPAPAPGASPYDATYYADLANATHAANSKINTYNADLANGRTALQNALAQITYNQGLQTTRAQDAENARGGFALGALGTTVGQIAHAAQQTSGADTLKYQQDAQNWQNAITAVNQGLSDETIALQLAAGARAAANVAKSGGTLGAAGAVPANDQQSAVAARQNIAQLQSAQRAAQAKQNQRVAQQAQKQGRNRGGALTF